MTFGLQISDVLDHAYVWNDKSGKAFKFKSQDSNYRLYRPNTNPTPDGGVLLFAKVDHIRGGGAKDDHAVVNMTFDQNGKLVAGNADFEIQGHDNILADFSEAISAASDLNPKAEVAAVLTNVTGAVLNSIEKLNETGGRLVFPSVVDGLMSNLASLVLNQVNVTRNYVVFTTSQDSPQSGQKHRSSDDFSFSEDNKLTIDIIGSSVYGWNQADNIKFGLKINKSGKDPVEETDLAQGSSVSLKKGKKYYIADPKYTNSTKSGHTSFVIGFYK